MEQSFETEWGAMDDGARIALLRSVADFLLLAVNEHPELITPDMAKTCFSAGIAATDVAFDECSAHFSAFESASPEIMAAMLLQIPITENHDPEAKLNKKLALAVADTFGPDWAQAFYRFAVLVTKLA